MRALYRVHDGPRWNQKIIEQDNEPLTTMGKVEATKTLTFNINNKSYETGFETTGKTQETHYIKISFEDIDKMHKFIHEGEK